MTDNGHCNICDTQNSSHAGIETATISSNVRRFKDERFSVWRCASCRSIHARDKIDLDHYYAHYPFHHQKLDWMLRAVYRTFHTRLKRDGLRKHHSILDYGCGSGLLVSTLRSKGYTSVTGFDAYSTDFSDPSVLEQRYDCIIAQDLVEHVDDPRAVLRKFDTLVRPGGLILIGTPNADAINLDRADDHVHTLHQPYHTHMFSKDALIKCGQETGWSVVRLYMTNYTNTLVPCVNLNFGLHYAKCFDNTLDLAFDGIRTNRKLLSLRTLYLAFFGYFRAPEADITVIFRAGSDPTNSIE